jgi:hypothetical protein
MKLILAVICALIASSVVAQTAMRAHPTTDADKTADALKAGPSFITKDATLLSREPPGDGLDGRPLLLFQIPHASLTRRIAFPRKTNASTQMLAVAWPTR